MATVRALRNMQITECPELDLICKVGHKRIIAMVVVCVHVRGNPQLPREVDLPSPWIDVLQGEACGVYSADL